MTTQTDQDDPTNTRGSDPRHTPPTPRGPVKPPSPRPIPKGEQEPEQAPTEPSQTEQETDQDAGGNNEAAKYRRRLRDTEAERDALSDRLTALQRAEIERLASEHLHVGAGIWAAAELSDMLDDDGNIDPSKVETIAVDARTTLGLAEPVIGASAPLEGTRSLSYAAPTTGLAGMANELSKPFE